jgi:hypothetical protein
MPLSGTRSAAAAVDRRGSLGISRYVALLLLLIDGVTHVVADFDGHIASRLYQMEGGRWTMKQTQ